MKIKVFLGIGLVLLLKAYGQDSISIVPREGKFKNYPCKECHKKAWTNKREFTKENFNKMKKHKEISYKHMPEVTNCFLCHSYNDADQLNLLDGKKIHYNDVTILCGQCHGLRKKEWEEGFHGFQRGKWNGPKERFSCIECHEPHHPKFPLMKAFPPPKRPKGGH